MGANARLLYNAYKMNAPSVDVLRKERRDVEDNLTRVTSQIRELIAAKERYGSEFRRTQNARQ